MTSGDFELCSAFFFHFLFVFTRNFQEKKSICILNISSSWRISQGSSANFSSWKNDEQRSSAFCTAIMQTYKKRASIHMAWQIHTSSHIMHHQMKESREIPFLTAFRLLQYSILLLFNFRNENPFHFPPLPGSSIKNLCTWAFTKLVIGEKIHEISRLKMD